MPKKNTVSWKVVEKITYNTMEGRLLVAFYHGEGMGKTTGVMLTPEEARGLAEKLLFGAKLAEEREAALKNSPREPVGP